MENFGKFALATSMSTFIYFVNIYVDFLPIPHVVKFEGDASK